MPKKPTLRRLRGDEANFRALYRSVRKSARQRSHSFQLTPERFRELTKQPCYVCGKEPAQLYRHDNGASYQVPYVFNGIDRISNDAGYVDGNCAPCCKKCNFAKGKGTLEDLLLYIYRAYHHSITPALEEGFNNECSEEDETD